MRTASRLPAGKTLDDLRARPCAPGSAAATGRAELTSFVRPRRQRAGFMDCPAPARSPYCAPGPRGLVEAGARCSSPRPTQARCSSPASSQERDLAPRPRQLAKASSLLTVLSCWTTMGLAPRWRRLVLPRSHLVTLIRRTARNAGSLVTDQQVALPESSPRWEHIFANPMATAAAMAGGPPARSSWNSTVSPATAPRSGPAAQSETGGEPGKIPN